MKTNEKLAFFMELVNCNYNLHYWHFDRDFHLLETDWPNDLFSGDFFDFIGFEELISRQISASNHTPLLLEAQSNLLWIAAFVVQAHTVKDIHMVGPIFGAHKAAALRNHKEYPDHQ